MLSKGVIIHEVLTKQQLNTFLKIPWRIYNNDPYWVPPLLFVQKQLLNKKKNPFFKKR